MIKPEIVKQGIVFESLNNSTRQSCAFAGVCALRDGRWLITCRAAPGKESTLNQQILFRYSDDEGASWSELYNPFEDVPQIDGKKGLFRAAYLTELMDEQIIAVLYWVDHSKPELPFFNEETNGLLDSRIFTSFSKDKGIQWTPPVLVDTGKFNMATPLTGPVLQLPNNDLACHFELQKHYYASEEWRHSSMMIFSDDLGDTWPESTAISSDPENRIFYWDQRPNVLPDGRILDLFWTYNKAQSFYMNIHAKESLDNGRTWSEFWDTEVAGQPAPPIALDDGRILMVFVDRSGSPSIKGRVSDDNGRTWPEYSEFDIYFTSDRNQDGKKSAMKDAWSEMGTFSLGLPATAKLTENSVLVAFYAGTDGDHTNIHWAKISF